MDIPEHIQELGDDYWDTQGINPDRHEMFRGLINFAVDREMEADLEEFKPDADYETPIPPPRQDPASQYNPIPIMPEWVQNSLGRTHPYDVNQYEQAIKELREERRHKLFTYMWPTVVAGPKPDDYIENTEFDFMPEIVEHFAKANPSFQPYKLSFNQFAKMVKRKYSPIPQITKNIFLDAEEHIEFGPEEFHNDYQIMMVEMYIDFVEQQNRLRMMHHQGIHQSIARRAVPYLPQAKRQRKNN